MPLVILIAQKTFVPLLPEVNISQSDWRWFYSTTLSIRSVIRVSWGVLRTSADIGLKRRRIAIKAWQKLEDFLLADPREKGVHYSAESQPAVLWEMELCALRDFNSFCTTALNSVYYSITKSAKRLQTCSDPIGTPVTHTRNILTQRCPKNRENAKQHFYTNAVF